MKFFNRCLRRNGQISIFHVRQDVDEIVSFCNMLAKKVDELVAEVNRLQRIAERSAETKIAQLEAENEAIMRKAKIDEALQAVLGGKSKR